MTGFREAFKYARRLGSPLTPAEREELTELVDDADNEGSQLDRIWSLISKGCEKPTSNKEERH